MKRILTVQDISCVGKCSLTVALPVISAMGIEACPLPTALLSTHTAFPSFTFRDLTGEMDRIAENLAAQDLTFDGIYTGYLGSHEQIDRVITLIDRLKRPDALVLIDPAMADNGKLYAGFDSAFPAHMMELCRCADVIVPNVTEACLLLGRPVPETVSPEEAQSLLRLLTNEGPAVAVLTGVTDGDDMGAMLYDRRDRHFCSVMASRLPRFFHGTGDLFASTLFSALIRGQMPDDALDLAVSFTHEAMEKTIADETAPWYGVNFEAALPGLIRKINKI